MKRANNLMPQIATTENIRLAAWKAAKGKRHAREVLNWMTDVDRRVLDIHQQLSSGIVQVGEYRYFTIYEPKERKICAAAFGEQVMHHSLMNICHPYFEKKQIFDSYASRKGKGTYAAIERAQMYARRYPWYLKLDVKKFFDSICHEVLVLQLAGMFKDRTLVGIFEQIIHSYAAAPGSGLPIGNLTSQYFANHYLNGLDHYIRETLQVPGYVRYMDDLVLWRDDKAALKRDFVAIRAYIETELRCSLKPESLHASWHGLPFLGYRILPEKVRLLAKSKIRYIRKLRTIHQAYIDGTWSEARCCRHALPLLAFVQKAETHNFRKSIHL